MSRFLLLPLVVGAVACEEPLAPYTSDVFWIRITDEGTACPDPAITSNYNAEPIQGAAVLDISRESTESTGGEYAYVTRGEDDTILLNFRGEVLVGTENNNGQIEVTWTNEEITTDTIDLETFQSTLINERAVEQTMTLRRGPNEENPTYGGSYQRRDRVVIDLNETDEWDIDALGIPTQYEDTDEFLTWIVPPDPPFQGSSLVRNRSRYDDCPESDFCEFRYEEDCTRQFTVDAVLLDGAGVDDFEALAGFDQPNGVE